MDNGSRASAHGKLGRALTPAIFVTLGLGWAAITAAFMTGRVAGTHPSPALVTLVTIASFAVLGGVLLYLQRLSDDRMPSASSSRRSLQTAWWPMALFGATALMIAVAGQFVFRAQADYVRDDRSAQLGYLAGVKAQRVRDWIDERIADIELDAAVIADLDPDGPVRELASPAVQSQLERMLDGRELTGVVLFDARGRRLAAAGQPIWQGSTVQGLLRAVAGTGAGHASDLYRADGVATPVVIDFAAPIPASDGVVLVARSDASRTLSQIVETGATRLRSLEVTLLRRDGEGVTLLDTTRLHGGARQRELRIEGQDPQLVAVRLAAGEPGPVVGVDRTGTRVLAVASPVVGTSWRVAAKVATDEVYAPLVKLTLLVGALVLSALLAAGALVALWWRGERLKFALQVSRAEDRASALLEHFGSVTEHVNDLVYLLDADHNIVDVNQRVVEALGYAKHELVGRHISSLHDTDPATRAAGRAAADQLRQTGRLRFESAYLRKDGTPLPFEASARCFEVRGQRYVQSVARDVTERRLQEQRLAELSRDRDRALHQLRLQFDNLSQGCIITTPDLAVLRVNPAFERMFGWSAADLAGRELLEVLLPPAARPYVGVRLARLRNGDGPITEEHPAVTASGKRLSCRITYSPLLDEGGRVAGLMALCEDVTEQRATQRALQERTAMLQALAEAAPVGILQVDLTGQAIYHNAQWCRITGQDPGSVRHGDWRDVIHPEDRAAVATALAEGSDGGRYSGEFRCLTPDGRVVWVLGRIAPVRTADGRVAGYVGTLTDIGERVAAERSLRESHEQLERRVEERTRDLVAARDRAQHADHVKSEFLATMSHELRTPLNSILGFTDVMLQGMVGTLTGEQRRHLGIVRDSSSHLLELINDVLDMSRIEAGQLRLEPAAFDAGELVRRRTQAFETAARDRGLELQVDVEAGTGDAVGDPRRVAQIIGNLVTNALKFTESGRIVVSSRRAGGIVEVAVRDTGVGIAPENLSELFAPFRQFRSPTGRLHEGTGLGLAISRNLARAMGGDVHVASVVGEGSTFTLVLPAADRAAAA